jgi:hypothetical protein
MAATGGANVSSEEQSDLAILEAMTDGELINVTLEELVELLTFTGLPDRNVDLIAFDKWNWQLQAVSVPWPQD